MAKPPYRPGAYARILINFWDSVSPRRMFPPKGDLIGKDPFGNKYFEIPADPRRGKRHPKRWYASPTTGEKETIGTDVWGGFDAELPPEWESWLRHRREASPSDEEVIRSLALADLKKRNAAELDEKHRIEKIAAGQNVADPNQPTPMDHEKTYFPKYKEYEIMPGEEPKGGDRWKDYKNPYSKQ